jgi:hypothetical protein
MFRGFLLILLCIAEFRNVQAGIQVFPSLPNGATPVSVQVDSTGYICVAGSVPAQTPANNDSEHALPRSSRQTGPRPSTSPSFPDRPPTLLPQSRWAPKVRPI